ncbi:ATP-binding protein [Rhodalgimonas zhirmunskyi]|uniref:Signal transduction histidine-protein kinase/phosphatase MprB n=1 Tax=Rhodalgimonas zhirmunskyi TaxID=2964767 RepID=A0AAJ1UB14_9RHOB|nr:ATP-binding protein [Rhodoalgimonas zhirmunskyi]MDQ2094383.1 ATP-binding protein [Rhodoalgimonas zhirmunskyi]
MSGIRQNIRQKWRPPLALVIGGTLAAVLLLPLVGIAYFRLAGNILGWGETAWLIFWMAVLSTLILGFLLWRLVLRPVWALTGYADAVRDGRDAPLPAQLGTPEFTTLTRAVQGMAETLQNREAGIRAYSDHVTHEMKSPLTSIAAAAELLGDDLEPNDRAELTTTIRTSVARMQALLEALQRLAAARSPLGRGPCDLAALVKTVQPRFSLTMRLETGGAIPLDPEAARVVLEQLAGNAEAHGATSLTLRKTGNTLVIQDDGPGIAAGDRARVFDPFFTTRRDTGGTGMGLSIVRAICEASGARIDLGEVERGTRFVISF